MTPKQAVKFVADHGVVLESARGSVPSLVDAVAGEPIHGSWWAHPKGQAIFRCTRAVREAADVLVCRLLGGKVTYVHRRLWPALFRLADRFDADRLGAIAEIHTDSGKHEMRTTPFPDWVSADVRRAAEALTEEVATSLLSVAPMKRLFRKTPKGRRTSR